MNLNKILGAAIVVLGLILAFRFMISGTLLFLIVAAVLALASATGGIGKSGYVLAGFFLLLAFAGSALGFALGTVRMLLRMAPLLAVLVGVYLLVRAFDRRK